ncbi:MAG TPA: hypothetical protein VMU88_04045 [bacterium]|nr:hypothetical protein [bacterium]
MKKIFVLTAILSLSTWGLAQAGPHPHGPFPKHKPSGKILQVHHNPHKPGPGSFRTASVHHGPR